jgi:heterodisulfide reductase subunit B
VTGFDDPEQPESMEIIARAAGAAPVDWNMKLACCGGSFSLSRTPSVVRLGREILADARQAGAEAILVACPMCHSNLDFRQKAMERRGEPLDLPILHLTQLVGLALGLDTQRLGLSRHFVDTAPLLRRLGGGPVAQTAPTEA